MSVPSWIIHLLQSLAGGSGFLGPNKQSSSRRAQLGPGAGVQILVLSLAGDWGGLSPITRDFFPPMASASWPLTLSPGPPWCCSPCLLPQLGRQILFTTERLVECVCLASSGVQRLFQIPAIQPANSSLFSEVILVPAPTPKLQEMPVMALRQFSEALLVCLNLGRKHDSCTPSFNNRSLLASPGSSASRRVAQASPEDVSGITGHMLLCVRVWAETPAGANRVPSATCYQWISAKLKHAGCTVRNYLQGLLA